MISVDLLIVLLILALNLVNFLLAFRQPHGVGLIPDQGVATLHALKNSI
jgi:hypothetical protein